MPYHRQTMPHSFPTAIGPNPSIEEETVTLTFGCSYDALTVEWEGIYDYEYSGTYLESVDHLQYTCYDINGTEVR